MARILPSGHTALALAAACLGTAAFAAPASAGTVWGTDYPEFYFTAAPGEVNNVRVSGSFDEATGVGEIRLTDTGAPITWHPITNPSGGVCSLPDANTVVCRYTQVYSNNVVVDVALGDQNDRATMDASLSAFAVLEPDQQASIGTIFKLNGGTGNDSLVDQTDLIYPPTIYGDDGNDTLRGAAGNNYLSGGAGNDIMIGYEGADGLDGGSGADTISYRDGRGPGGVVVVDYDAPAALKTYSGNSSDYTSIVDYGPVGDSVYGVETIIGTSYDDVLIGNAADNVLIGSGGKDQLLGAAGNDTLTVTGGPSKLYGGAGNDTLNARNATADTKLDCNTGNDIANLDLLDTGWTGCENVVRQ